MADAYALYYWPIPFRGHFIRFILAHAGATWTEPDFRAMAAFKDQPVADKPYPFLAPPVLHDLTTGRWLAQMPAIVMSLGRKYGLSRDADQELRLISDASDILFEITRYHGASMWDRASWNVFASTRLPLWMQLHEKFATDNGVTVGAGYLFAADTPGLGDLILAALWHTMVDRLPKLRPLLHATAPAIEGLGDRIAARPEIAALLQSWAGSPERYCAGEIEKSLLEMLEGAPG